MKLLLVALLTITTSRMNLEEIEIVTLRKLYYEAAESKAAAVKLTSTLSKVNDQSKALLICYKGAAQMMEAKYAFSPITKFSKFSKGKSAIEKAIVKDPKQIEIRFIRFSIQTNLPFFLGYNESIKTDKEMLINSINKIDDENLKQNVVNYLLTSKYCTSDEIKRIRNWQKT
ncbi:hypothetical protein EZ428_15830 [Pedobacter frigiditerrae]|uniref:Uncharacterized protein n=1 Tax=Pedobacter frigiditerrae TaxID=2530452 RepID=A0A4R0MQN5_9SPHI|nr:hypothetical protein [Pedobacter frigiditerrae]TCC89170.1 hypothetical protein EZ428_15830 [Pedobacter frigiditerrae]